MFGLIKKAFLAGLTILSTLAGVNWLISISMNNQECKVRPEIVNFNSDEPVFYPFVLKPVNAVVVVTISMIHTQKYVSLKT